MYRGFRPDTVWARTVRLSLVYSVPENCKHLPQTNGNKSRKWRRFCRLGHLPTTKQEWRKPRGARTTTRSPAALCFGPRIRIVFYFYLLSIEPPLMVFRIKPCWQTESTERASPWRTCAVTSQCLAVGIWVKKKGLFYCKLRQFHSFFLCEAYCALHLG